MPDREDRSSRIEQELFLRSLQMGSLGVVAEAMAARMRTVFFAAGTTIFREGEAAPLVYFIKRGEVALVKHGEAPWVFRDREIVGVLDVMQDRARARTAVAERDTIALVVSADDWFELLEDNFDVTRRAVANVARGLFEMGLQLPPTGGFPPPTPDDTESRPIRSLDTVERIIALREAPLLVQANVQPLADLAVSLDEMRLASGEVLFRRGDPVDAFFLVARGLVEVTSDDPVVRAGFGPGQVVGGYGAIAHTDQPFDAIARFRSLVFRVGHEQYFDLMEDHFELARSLLAEMAVAREDLMRRVAERAGMVQEEPMGAAPMLSSAR